MSWYYHSDTNFLPSSGLQPPPPFRRDPRHAGVAQTHRTHRPLEVEDEEHEGDVSGVHVLGEEAGPQARQAEAARQAVRWWVKLVH